MVLFWQIVQSTIKQFILVITIAWSFTNLIRKPIRILPWYVWVARCQSNTRNATNYLENERVPVLSNHDIVTLIMRTGRCHDSSSSLPTISFACTVNTTNQHPTLIQNFTVLPSFAMHWEKLQWLPNLSPLPPSHQHTSTLIVTFHRQISKANVSFVRLCGCDLYIVRCDYS